MHAQPLNAIVGKTIVAQHQRTHNNKARVPSLEMFTNVFNEFFGNDNSTTCTTQCISQKCYNTFGSISTYSTLMCSPNDKKTNKQTYSRGAMNGRPCFEVGYPNGLTYNLVAGLVIFGLPGG